MMDRDQGSRSRQGCGFFVSKPRLDSSQRKKEPNLKTGSA
jgi:hypothetical protein